MEETPNSPASTPVDPAVTPAPSGSSPSSVSLLMEELKSLTEPVRNYIRPFIWAVSLAVLAGVLVWVFQKRQAVNEQVAAERLFTARSIEEIEQTAERHAGTAAAPMLWLRAAKTRYTQGNLAMALSHYEEFIQRFPGHAMLDTARMGRLVCMEGMGRSVEALQGYEQLLEQSGNQHYLTAQAVLGRARCLRQVGRSPEARIVLEDYLVENPRSSWGSLVREFLDVVKKETVDPVEPAGAGTIPDPVSK